MVLMGFVEGGTWGLDQEEKGPIATDHRVRTRVLVPEVPARLAALGISRCLNWPSDR